MTVYKSPIKLLCPLANFDLESFSPQRTLDLWPISPRKMEKISTPPPLPKRRTSRSEGPSQNKTPLWTMLKSFSDFRPPFWETHPNSPSNPRLRSDIGRNRPPGHRWPASTIWPTKWRHALRRFERVLVDHPKRIVRHATAIFATETKSKSHRNNWRFYDQS